MQGPARMPFFPADCLVSLGQGPPALPSAESLARGPFLEPGRLSTLLLVLSEASCGQGALLLLRSPCYSQPHQRL